MLSRLVGAQIRLFSVDELRRKGGYNAIFEEVARELRAQGRNPYIIPVGGSKFVLFNQQTTSLLPILSNLIFFLKKKRYWYFWIYTSSS